MRKEKNKKGFTQWIFVLLFFLSVIFIFFPGSFLDFSTKVPFGHHSDVKNIVGIIAFSLHSPLTQIYHLPIFYPESFVLARTHPLFGVSLIFKIFRTAGLNLHQSYNLYVILSLLLGAVGCYLLAREFSQSKLLSAIMASVYIIHRWNFVHVAWLNFLSLFFVPYIILCFLRFFKTRKTLYLLLAGFLSFYQFLVSIYYGLFLWCLILPLFLIFALLLKLLDFKDLVRVAILFILLLVILIWIFHPFARQSLTAESVDNNKSSVTPADLFSYSRPAAALLGYPQKPALGLFPGFVFLFFPLVYLVWGITSAKQRIPAIVLASFFVFSMGIMVFINLIVLNILFVVFSVLILLALIRSRNLMVNREKLIVFTFFSLTVLSLDFGALFFNQSASLLDLIQYALPFGGLKVIHRVYLIILPFTIILGTLGAEKLLESWKVERKRAFILFSGLVALLILLENIPMPFPIQEGRKMRPLFSVDQGIYRQLPFRQNRVILEIPFYFRLPARNSRYLLYWTFHQNYLLNGKTSVKSPDYMQNLKAIIGGMQKQFPNRLMLKTLIEKYSVDHVVFHWDLLSRYQKDPQARTKIVRRIESIPDYCRIKHDSETATIVRIREYHPLQSIKRCYSLAHLKRCRLKITFMKPYSGDVEIYLENHLVEKRAADSDVFLVDLSRQKLALSGNEIELKFNEPVVLRDIQLRE